MSRNRSAFSESKPDIRAMRLRERSRSSSLANVAEVWAKTYRMNASAYASNPDLLYY